MKEKGKGSCPLGAHSLRTPLSPILEILRSAIPFEPSAIRPTSAIRPLFGKVGGALASILPVIYELSSPFIPFTVLREDRGVVVNAIRPWHSAKAKQ